MVMDGFDDCIIGVAYRCGMEPVVVCDREIIIGKMIKEGSTEEEAIEWHELSKAGACVGERTPIFMSRLEV